MRMYWGKNSLCNSYFQSHFDLPYFQKTKILSFRINLRSVCVSLWLVFIHLKDSIDWPIFNEIWYEHCAPGGRSNPLLLPFPRSVITIRRTGVLVRGDRNQRAFLFSEMTSGNIFFFLVTLRPDSGAWPHSYGVSRSHSFDTIHSVGFICVSDQLDTVTSTWQHTTLIIYKHLHPRRDSNPQSQQASGRRPTP